MVIKLSSAQLVQILNAGPIDVHVIINSLAYILANGHNFFHLLGLRVITLSLYDYTFPQPATLALQLCPTVLPPG